MSTRLEIYDLFDDGRLQGSHPQEGEQLKLKVRMMLRLIVFPVLAAIASTVYALGLGAPIGIPLLGKPLRLDIPLTGHSGAPPGSECFRLENAAATTDEPYFPRAARAYIEMRQGKPMVVVVAPTITKPFVEFRLSIECGFGFARDFILLTDLQTLDATVIENAPEQPFSAPQLPTDVAPEPRIAAVSAPVRILPQDTTLKALADEEYPSQSKARENLKSMMQATNGELIQASEGFDWHLPPHGTELTIPTGLPKRRYGPYIAPLRMEPASQTSAAPAGALHVTVRPSKNGVAKRKAPKDRLTVGAAAALPMTPAAIYTTLDRLVSTNAEQAKEQEEQTARIARAQDALAEVKLYVLQMKARIRGLEDERKELKRKSELAQTWQLAIAVLLGGVLGAGILRAYPRLVPRKQDAEAGAEQ